MTQGSSELRTNVKAAKRQNKLLEAALQKANRHKSEFEDVQNEIVSQTATVRRDAVSMPNLIFSPFLPLSEQLEQQRQLELLNADALGGSGMIEPGFF